MIRPVSALLTRTLELVIGDRLGNPAQLLRQLKASGRVAPSSYLRPASVRVTVPSMGRRS